MITFQLVRHHCNQYGWGVSLTKHVDGRLEEGYILRYFEGQDAQRVYVYDLSTMTGFLVDDHVEG